MNPNEHVANLDAVLHKMKAAGWVTGWTFITDPWVIDWTDLGKIHAAKFPLETAALGLTGEEPLYLETIIKFFPPPLLDEGENLSLN